MKKILTGVMCLLIIISSKTVVADDQNNAIVKTSIEEVVVFGLPLGSSNLESAQPINVISAEELHSKQASTLGETLKYEVGVHSTNYGGVSSSPIIRGLDGPRVLISQNGLDVGDVSRVGPDHGVSTEASTAEQIEVLRGPATLFYGSGAIGGVVNIVDDRVPFDNTLKMAAIAEYNHVNNEKLISFANTAGKNSLAYHIDGFKRISQDYEIAGPANLAHPDEITGTLENSQTDSKGGNVGMSYLFDEGYIGLSFGRLEKFNGIPGHDHSDDEIEVEETLVFSDMLQNRWQMIGNYDIDNTLFKSITSRFAYTDYQHNEIEQESGIRSLGTIFESQTRQWRGEFAHQDAFGWQGVFVPSYKKSSFDAIGEEAFTPPSTTTEKALAIIEERKIADVLWQAGIRIENVDIKLDGNESLSLPAFDTSFAHKNSYTFKPKTTSLGFVWDVAEGYNIGVSYTNASRAPSAAELFSYGNHLATRSFEIGAVYASPLSSIDGMEQKLPTIALERSRNIDISFKKFSGDTGFIITMFHNTIDNYFSQNNLGITSDILNQEDAATPDAEQNILPVYQFVQTDARLYGAEMEFSWQINDIFNMAVWGDTVTAKMSSGEYLPRSPASRLGIDLNYTQGQLQSEIHLVRYFAQNHVAQYESNTAGNTMLDARVDYQFKALSNDLHMYLAINNMLDNNARSHTSFLKEMAPLPARNIKVGLSYYF